MASWRRSRGSQHHLTDSSIKISKFQGWVFTTKLQFILSKPGPLLSGCGCCPCLSSRHHHHQPNQHAGTRRSSSLMIRHVLLQQQWRLSQPHILAFGSVDVTAVARANSPMLAHKLKFLVHIYHTVAPRFKMMHLSHSRLALLLYSFCFFLLFAAAASRLSVPNTAANFCNSLAANRLTTFWEYPKRPRPRTSNAPITSSR